MLRGERYGQGAGGSHSSISIPSGRMVPSSPSTAGAIPPALIQSELFEPRERAFTDAWRRHIGCAEEGAQGILFLDEIEELPVQMQVNPAEILAGAAP